MKKALAILMALAMIVPAVFAEDAVTYGNEAAVTVEGNATLSWGMDLETEAHGFKNAAEWKVIIPLLSKQTFAHKGDGDNFAEISIVDAQYMIQGDHDGDTAFTAGDKKIDKVTAQLNFGPVYATVYDKPGFKTNNANIWDPIKNDSYGDAAEEDAWHFEPGFDGYGTKIGYKNDTLNIGAKVGSLGTYEGVKADSKYAFGIDASFKPSDLIDLSATFNYATWARTTTAAIDGKKKDGIMSIGAKLVSKPVDGLELTLGVDAGNDYVTEKMTRESFTTASVTKKSDAFAFDALVSAKYKFVEGGAYIAAPGTPYAGTKMTFGSDFVKSSEKVMGLAVYGKLTDGDFVENLDAWATVMASNLLSDTGIAVLPMAIGTGANYKYAMNDVNYIKPFFEFFANNYFGFDVTTVDFSKETSRNDAKKEVEQYAYAANVGVEYGLFTNTIVTVKYETGATKNNNLIGPVDKNAKSDNGLVTVACKISY